MWFNTPVGNQAQELLTIWCQENLYLHKPVHFLLSSNKNGTIYSVALFALAARDFGAKLDDQLQ